MKLTPRLSLLGLSLALAACNGDDMTTAGSASETGSTSGSSVSATASATTSTTGATTDTQGGSGTDSMGTTSGASTGSTSDSGTATTSESDGSTSMPVTTGPDPVCGDGDLDDGEECDDGNLAPDDGCEPDCTITMPKTCGNEMLDDGEACDGDLFMGETECKLLDDQYSGCTVSCGGNCQLDYSGCEKCEAPGQLLPCDADSYIKGTSDDILHAIELACDSADPMFADPNKHIPVTEYMPLNVANGSWRVIKQFGTYLDPMDNNLPIWRPRKGDRMLLISSGNLPQPDGNGVLTQPGGTITGTNGNPDGLGDMPGIINWEKGSNNGGGGTPFMNCDMVNDCSDTLDAQWNLGSKSANDVFYFQHKVKVPKGTYGYVVDFAYFSSEYPVFVNTSFNDMAILWSTSETYTGNVTFITDNNNNPRPLTVTALAQNNLIKYRGDKNPKDPQLNGTGFQDNGGTGWATVKGPAQPEETLTLAWTVFDKADGVLDTALLVDNWQWDCAGCVPSEIDSCGVQPQ